MKVVFSSEAGTYLDFAAAGHFFNDKSEFYIAESYEQLFAKIEEDPSFFGIIPGFGLGDEENQAILKKIFSKRIKIFAEGNIEPTLHLFVSDEYKKQIPPKIYTEISTKLIFEDFAVKFPNSEIIYVKDLLEIVEANPYELAIITTKDFLQTNNLHLHHSARITNFTIDIPYYVIGRAFYDLPSDDSNKVIAIVNINSEIEISSFFDKKRLKLQSLIKNPNFSTPNQSEYYLEIEFDGLLDLNELENKANSIHILGIIERGKRVKI